MQCVGRAELWLLVDKPHTAGAANHASDIVSLMPDNDGRRDRSQRPSCTKDVIDQRPAGQTMQHLRSA